MTANDVFEYALALLDETNTDDYSTNAPKFIDMLHRELAKCEDVTLTTQITALDDELEISDDTALGAMVYGLAAKLALVDRDVDLYNEMQAMYLKAKSEIRLDEEDYDDIYSVLSGLGVTETDEDEF